MTIWQVKTGWKYKSLGYDEEHYVKYIMAYRRGELSRWQPVYVGYSNEVYISDMDEMYDRFPHFPGLSSDIACDEKAKSILDELIHGYVDFLPLASHTITDKQYCILYPKTLLDCLDNERTEFVRTQSGFIFGVRRYVFKSDCIGDTPIFRLPLPTADNPSPIFCPYVNDEFKQLVEDNNLTGLEFEKVWEG